VRRAAGVCGLSGWRSEQGRRGLAAWRAGLVGDGGGGANSWPPRGGLGGDCGRARRVVSARWRRRCVAEEARRCPHARLRPRRSPAPPHLLAAPFPHLLAASSLHLLAAVGRIEAGSLFQYAGGDGPEAEGWRRWVGGGGVDVSLIPPAPLAGLLELRQACTSHGIA